MSNTRAFDFQPKVVISWFLYGQLLSAMWLRAPQGGDVYLEKCGCSVTICARPASGSRDAFGGETVLAIVSHVSFFR
ncbi:unnamed protein product [Merluccius merluccius]